MSSHWAVAPRRSFSGKGAIRPPAARVPSMAEGQMTASVSAELADQSFSRLTTSNSDPVWAHHSPRSRPMAVAMAGSSTTVRRSFMPESGCWFVADFLRSAFEPASSQPAIGRMAKRRAARSFPRRFAGIRRGAMRFNTSRAAEGSPIGRIRALAARRRFFTIWRWWEPPEPRASGAEGGSCCLQSCRRHNRWP